ncbi:agarase [Rhodopseudomonas palustris]|uniref:agarase n=1 Tax=Rhodopseudomonas palustris TaxID=1076 RepID=UPI00005D9BEC
MRRTKWGGLADGCFEPSGFFRVEQDDGVFWFVDPDGGRFLSKGVNNVQFAPDQIRGTDRTPYAEACLAKYGSRNEWRRAAAERLTGWDFNTLGCWSDEIVAGAGALPLATAPIVDLGASFWLHRHGQRFPDVFDAEFDNHIRQRAKDLCTPRRNAPELLGTFIDNELYWSPDWRGHDELLTTFLNFPPGRAGRVTAITALQQHYGEFAHFNVIWHTPVRSWEALHALETIAAPFVRAAPGGDYAVLEAEANRNPRRAAFAADCDAFAAVVADRYFELCTAAIKAADPNHLVLGARLGALPHDGVVAAAGRHLDVISFNCYGFDPSALLDAYAVTGKPCLITEFSFRGDDAGLPNSCGGGPRVATQADRAHAFERYVAAALIKPNLVGYHWFEHADQPAEGRFDGEDCNYGTVTIKDEVYPELTASMSRLNAAAESIHRKAVAARPAA